MLIHRGWALMDPSFRWGDDRGSSEATHDPRLMTHDAP
jgi:hypothetical protein